MTTVPAPASADEALADAACWMSYLAAADPAALAAQTQADCLQALEQLDAVETATPAWILGAFTASQGYSADADYSPTAWLIHRTKVTKGAARGHLGWPAASRRTPRWQRRWPRNGADRVDGPDHLRWTGRSRPGAGRPPTAS